MRIVSDFHDYYDSVQALGQDLTVVYVRKRKELSENFPFPKCKPSTARLWWTEKPAAKEFIIGFCGKIYPALELSVSKDGKVAKVAVCHTIADVDAFVEANFKKREVEEYRKTSGSSRRWRYYSRRMYFEEWFEECRQKQDTLRSWFIDHRCPIFTVEQPSGFKGQSKIILNARLKDLKFYRLVDTYTAFQEVNSFVAGLAIPPDNIPPISDLDMRDAKGFTKWSFKKEPTKKR